MLTAAAERWPDFAVMRRGAQHFRAGLAAIAFAMRPLHRRYPATAPALPRAALSQPPVCALIGVAPRPPRRPRGHTVKGSRPVCVVPPRIVDGSRKSFPMQVHPHVA